MRNRKTAVVLLCSLILLVGCDDKLLKVAQAAKDFSAAVKAVQAAEITAHDNKLIADDVHGKIQNIFLEVAYSGQELDIAVNVAHSKPDAFVALSSSITSLDRLMKEGVVNIKDDKTRAELSIAIISAKSLLSTISAVIGGKQ